MATAAANFELLRSMDDFIINPTYSPAYVRSDRGDDDDEVDPFSFSPRDLSRSSIESANFVTITPVRDMLNMKDRRAVSAAAAASSTASSKKPFEPPMTAAMLIKRFLPASSRLSRGYTSDEEIASPVDRDERYVDYEDDDDDDDDDDDGKSFRSLVSLSSSISSSVTDLTDDDAGAEPSFVGKEAAAGRVLGQHHHRKAEAIRLLFVGKPRVVSVVKPVGTTLPRTATAAAAAPELHRTTMHPRTTSSASAQSNSSSSSSSNAASWGYPPFGDNEGGSGNVSTKATSVVEGEGPASSREGSIRRGGPCGMAISFASTPTGESSSDAYDSPPSSTTTDAAAKDAYFPAADADALGDISMIRISTPPPPSPSPSLSQSGSFTLPSPNTRRNRFSASSFGFKGFAIRAKPAPTSAPSAAAAAADGYNDDDSIAPDDTCFERRDTLPALPALPALTPPYHPERLSSRLHVVIPSLLPPHAAVIEAEAKVDTFDAAHRAQYQQRRPQPQQQDPDQLERRRQVHSYVDDDGYGYGYGYGYGEDDEDEDDISPTSLPSGPRPQQQGRQTRAASVPVLPLHDREVKRKPVAAPALPPLTAKTATDVAAPPQQQQQKPQKKKDEAKMPYLRRLGRKGGKRGLGLIAGLRGS